MRMDDNFGVSGTAQKEVNWMEGPKKSSSICGKPSEHLFFLVCACYLFTASLLCVTWTRLYTDMRAYVCIINSLSLLIFPVASLFSLYVTGFFILEVGLFLSFSLDFFYRPLPWPVEDVQISNNSGELVACVCLNGGHRYLTHTENNCAVVAVLLVTLK
ncbi:uncharacterized protein TEOVI_000027000 [Trypanosoma equiperdum]|uniref:Uncharacterized protein n=2 Tax=Trypanozoon TaxID=39700 RepID=Q57W96_TRYB2|nr:hypothetical protein Tb927.3.3600 [Trypanosoma brucei brucei TREU927]AAX70086.1 hypothetical protein Tb927.3.3600 [Trypanosoma brucei]AAZ10393.1 hypothetical protein Tb927.3.3600 [Trypanosoma brucei brucei TREU927]SCU66060.1 hypothetical protein, conserved [Trypanosoma equiperdum]